MATSGDQGMATLSEIVAFPLHVLKRRLTHFLSKAAAYGDPRLGGSMIAKRPTSLRGPVKFIILLGESIMTAPGKTTGSKDRDCLDVTMDARQVRMR
jgi:hypothetical protein